MKRIVFLCLSMINSLIRFPQAEHEYRQLQGQSRPRLTATKPDRRKRNRFVARQSCQVDYAIGTVPE
jgi:hypothetical protein